MLARVRGIDNIFPSLSMVRGVFTCASSLSKRVITNYACAVNNTSRAFALPASVSGFMNHVYTQYDVINYTNTHNSEIYGQMIATDM